MEEERSASRLSLERAEKAEGVLAQKQDGFNSVLAHANAQVEAANDRVQVSLDPHVVHNCSHLFGHPPLPLGPETHAADPSQSLFSNPCPCMLASPCSLGLPVIFEDHRAPACPMRVCSCRLHCSSQELST